MVFAFSRLVALPAGALRFGVLGPLSWFSPRVREWVAVNASSLVVDLRYRRDTPSQQEIRGWPVQEAGVFTYLLAINAALVAELINAELLVQLYLISAAGESRDEYPAVEAAASGYAWLRSPDCGASKTPSGTNPPERYRR